MFKIIENYRQLLKMCIKCDLDSESSSTLECPKPDPSKISTYLSELIDDKKYISGFDDIINSLNEDKSIFVKETKNQLVNLRTDYIQYTQKKKIESELSINKKNELVINQNQGLESIIIPNFEDEKVESELDTNTQDSVLSKESVNDNNEKSYTVKKGDTLWKIVQNHYNLSKNSDIAKMVNYVVDHQKDGSMATRLGKDTNPKDFKDGIKGDKLRIGDKINLIPMPEKLENIKQSTTGPREEKNESINEKITLPPVIDELTRNA